MRPFFLVLRGMRTPDVYPSNGAASLICARSRGHASERMETLSPRKAPLGSWRGRTGSSHRARRGRPGSKAFQRGPSSNIHSFYLIIMDITCARNSVLDQCTLGSVRIALKPVKNPEFTLSGLKRVADSRKKPSKFLLKRVALNPNRVNL